MHPESSRSMWRSPDRFVRAIAILCIVSAPSQADLVHRWSFNQPAGAAPSGTGMSDSVSGLPAIVRGHGATFNGSALVLPGTTSGNSTAEAISGYIDLPNGTFSSKTNLSLEIWATPFEPQGNWSRLFNIGRVAGSGSGGGAPGEVIDLPGVAPGALVISDCLEMSWTQGLDLNAQRLRAILNGNENPIGTSLPTTAGTRYHYVLTFEDGAGAFGLSGGRVTWYRNGSVAASTDVNFRLENVEDVNNWLGRSGFTVDQLAHASYDECRIYDHALGIEEIAANLAAGPDVIPDPIEPVDPPVADHRWTFTTQAASAAPSGTTFTDDLGGLEATLRGNGGSLSGSSVVLPGSTNGNQSAASISAYLDLPNGIASASADVTFEAWATPLSSRFFQRLFDFGRGNVTHGPGAEPGEIIDSSIPPGATTGYDNLMVSLNNGNDINLHHFEVQIGGNPPLISDSTAATTPGTEYHYILIVESGAGEFGPAGSQARWYRDGILQNSIDFDFQITAINDVNNWIGRSQYSGDSNSNLALNEFRVYRRALSISEIIASRNEGPDPSTGPPEPPAPPPVPTNRWTFDTAPGLAPAGTPFTDEGTGEIATLRGNGASLNGTQLVLPANPTTGNQSAANISAYLDFRNGLISSNPSLTLEAWVTPLSSQAWQRVFDFGSASITHGPGALPGEIIDSGGNPGGTTSVDNLFLSLNIGNTLGSQRLEAKLAGATSPPVDINLAASTSAGVEYHYVMTVEDGGGSSGASGCLVRWYRDGVLHGSLDLNFRLTALNDVNNWIGRSQWSNDSNSHISINEIRLHQRALSAAEIASSFTAGPDAAFAPPVAMADSSVLHPGQKVLIDVLANDTGSPQPGSIEIVSPPASGTAVVQSSGKILYSHDNSGTAPDSFTYRVSNFTGASEPALVSLELSTSLRISNSDLAMPPAPPENTWALVDALPGLTFSNPIVLASPPGDTSRLFVGERLAQIQLIPNVTSPAPAKQLFLSLHEAVQGRTPNEVVGGGAYGENGLLGLAFHPDYEENGYFYVAYTVRFNNTDYQRISRFKVSANPAVADPSSERILLQQLDRVPNHNGGDIHFGPDGYLYYTAGDEGDQRDVRQNSQKIDLNFFAGIFRIDVDKRPGNLEPNPHPAIPTDGGIARFSVPLDNPFVHTSLGGAWDGTYNGIAITNLGAVRSEFWATGLRHVWRMSFDPETGDLWAGDVGQDTYEEVNKIVKGGNYGWVFRDGARDSNFTTPPKPPGFTSIDPFYEFLHTGVAGGDASLKGNSVVGGYIYRGGRHPSLQGDYIFSDSVSGHVWQLDTTTRQATRLAGLPGQYGVFASQGVDPANGDILFCAYNAGRILRLSSEDEVTEGFPQTLSATRLFSDLEDLSPAPGLLPVDPNLRFWSDHADKTRWFAIPDETSRMTWKKEGAWEYPTGMLWVKHFDLATTRGNPATNRRIETRVLVKTGDGVYGVSYKWNDEQTEAYLVPDRGDAFDIAINDGGFPHTQRWEIPGRANCLTCHGSEPLSFTTRQLNQVAVMNGFSGNQLELLHTGGYLENTPEPVATLPHHVRPDDTEAPLESRVRSYLEVNCAYCHQEGGSVSGFWDGRELLKLESTGLINGLPLNNGGNPQSRYVVPGDSFHSVLLSRVSGANGFTRMPPLATSEPDQEAIDLITEWIQSGLPADRLYGDWAAIHHPGLGGPDEDDDGDGVSNRDEFIRGSNPRSGADTPPATLTASEFTFERKPFRIYDIQTSTDLKEWHSWTGPENKPGFGSSSIMETIPLPAGQDPVNFFRLEITEP